MKKTIIAVGLLLAFSATTFSQAESAKPGQRKEYRVSVLDDQNALTKGILYSTNDTGITVKMKGEGGVPGYRKFSSEEIKSLKLEQKGSIGRGMLKGAIIGFTTGVTLGLLSGNDPKEMPDAMTAGQKALGAGVGFGIIGAATGAVINAIAHQKFVIGKDRNRYKLIQADLAQKSIAF